MGNGGGPAGGAMPLMRSGDTFASASGDVVICVGVLMRPNCATLTAPAAPGARSTVASAFSRSSSSLGVRGRKGGTFLWVTGWTLSGALTHHDDFSLAPEVECDRR